MCFIWMITITVWANRSLRQCFGGWTSLKYCCELRLWVEWVWGGTLQTMQLTMFLIKAVYCVGAELSWVCSMAKQYGSRTREDRCEWVSTWLRSIIVNVQLCWAEPHYHTVSIVLTHSHSSNIQLVNLKILMAWLHGTIIILLCLKFARVNWICNIVVAAVKAEFEREQLRSAYLAIRTDTASSVYQCTRPHVRAAQLNRAS